MTWDDDRRKREEKEKKKRRKRMTRDDDKIAQVEVLDGERDDGGVLLHFKLRVGAEPLDGDDEVARQFDCPPPKKYPAAPSARATRRETRKQPPPHTPSQPRQPSTAHKRHRGRSYTSKVFA